MTPNGSDLLSLLISLYAEQENVKIQCSIETEGETKWQKIS